MECTAHLERTNYIFKQSLHLVPSYCSNENELVQHHVGKELVCFGESCIFMHLNIMSLHLDDDAMRNQITAPGSRVEA